MEFFRNPRDNVDGTRKLRVNMEAAVRDYTCARISRGIIPVDDNVSRALSWDLSCSDCEHVGSAAETIGEEQDVGASSRSDREGAGAIDGDGNDGPFRQRH